MILFVHITSHVQGDPYPELLKEKGGRGFPTLLFLDPTGKVIGEPKGRTIADWEAALTDVLPKMPPAKGGKYKGPKILGLEDALKDGQKNEKPILLIVKGDDKPTEELTKLLYAEKMKKRVEAYLVVEKTFDKDDKTCKDLGLKEGAKVLILNPQKEKIEESVLATFSDKPSQDTLTAFLQKWEKGAKKEAK